MDCHWQDKRLHEARPPKGTGMDLINKIYHGDCLELMTDIDSASVDLILSDPPYLQSLSKLSPALDGKLIDWNLLSDQFYRILKPNGQVALFCDLITSVVLINAYQNNFRFRFHWVWQKPNGNPVNNKQPLSEIELILVWCKKDAKTRDLTFNHKDISTPGDPYSRKSIHQSKIRKQHGNYLTKNSSGQRFPRQVIQFPSKCNLTKQERLEAEPFPCYKPINLCGHVIKALSNPDNLILDPFSGSGSVAIVCHRLNRNFIAIEKDPEYYIESMGRLERERCQITLPF